MHPEKTKPLQLLSVVIPARDEEGCIASTVEHLHLELELRGVPHEIIVVDDGSTDRTWQILQAETARLNSPRPPNEEPRTQNDDPAPCVPSLQPSTLVPIQNPAPHGFGRAITRGLNSISGDAVVIMMASAPFSLPTSTSPSNSPSKPSSAAIPTPLFPSPGTTAEPAWPN